MPKAQQPVSLASNRRKARSRFQTRASTLRRFSIHYDTGKHCVFHHRYHLVWPTKYRYKVLLGNDQIRQPCNENGVDIIHGVLSSDHVHMFVSIPPKLAVSDLMRKMKGRSSLKVQRELSVVRVFGTKGVLN
jgi:REP element-mobilizing transposase RayT